MDGCVLCGRCPGKHVHDMHKTVFFGHRRCTPINSYVRIFGQTQECCPPDLLLATSKVKFDDLGYNTKNEKCFPLQLNQSKTRKSFKCGGHKMAQILNTVFDKEETYYFWAHERVIFDKRIFDDYLYYPCGDLRPQLLPPSSSRRQAVYVRLLREIEEANGQPVGGVKGPSVFNKLPYFNLFSQCSWIYCHCVANNIKQMMGFWKGITLLKVRGHVIHVYYFVYCNFVILCVSYCLLIRRL